MKKKKKKQLRARKTSHGHKRQKKSDKRELKAKIGIAKKIKGTFTGTITISKKDVSKFLEELELSLLEADVEAGTASAIVQKLGQELEGKKIPADSNVSGVLKEEIKKALLEAMHTKQIDFLQQANRHKPFVVLFLGPNGAGKTTSIAKIAHLLKKNGHTIILSASDTFRAASIEQLEVHAKALGVKIVKHDYGADPAAVAFDAISSARAKKTDVVLIDSAGRQETNKNLIAELKKIEKVSKPSIKIFVGESYVGQNLLHQAREFEKEIGLDGFVLTKMDVDSKGGAAISLLHSLKKPIIFAGTGQKYSDLIEFKPEFILNKII
ncbi:MAG: signal recognition particle-docking protein FtsY [Candidatus Diapherotrites archaeon]|nr:signal recognition particle-docking protein FtsY [Candidatus Diapherotrites archaeon]